MPAADRHFVCAFRPSACFMILGAAIALLSAGCQTPQQYFESLKGDGFPSWSDTLGNSVRGDAPAAKPSGFFTDRRSEQIEQSLGGSF
jgi:hypothetical protein